MKINIGHAVLLLLGIFALVYFYSLNPSTQGIFFVSCPFHKITGYQCPGCGSQRAIHELLHLNFKKAFFYNELLMVSIPYIMIGIAFNFKFIKDRFPETKRILFGNKTLLILLIVIIIFGIFRNL